jgi:hypothetical protein
MGFLDTALKNAMSAEAQQLEQLLELGRQKLVEAGKELLVQAETDLDGLTVTFAITISRKKEG